MLSHFEKVVDYIKRIIYNRELAEELMKNPDDFIIIGNKNDDYGRQDQQIINLFRKDVLDTPTTVINIGDFRENGMLKYYR